MARVNCQAGFRVGTAGRGYAGGKVTRRMESAGIEVRLFRYV